MADAPTQQPQSPPEPFCVQDAVALYRGVSVLLWSVPLYLIFAVQTFFTGGWGYISLGGLDTIGIFPTLLTAVAILHGVSLLQKANLHSPKLSNDLSRLLIYVLCVIGLSPFLLWYKQTGLYYFSIMILVLNAVALLGFMRLNRTLYHLVEAMGDEVLKGEMAIFALINTSILMALFVGYIFHGLIIYQAIESWNLYYFCSYYDLGLCWAYVTGLLIVTSITVWWTWNLKMLTFQKILSYNSETPPSPPTTAPTTSPSETRNDVQS